MKTSAVEMVGAVSATRVNPSAVPQKLGLASDAPGFQLTSPFAPTAPKTELACRFGQVVETVTPHKEGLLLQH